MGSDDSDEEEEEVEDETRSENLRKSSVVVVMDTLDPTTFLPNPVPTILQELTFVPIKTEPTDMQQETQRRVQSWLDSSSIPSTDNNIASDMEILSDTDEVVPKTTSQLSCQKSP